MSDVVLIRPGCTDFDEQNRIQGSIGLPLNSRGREQVQRMVDRLHDVPLEVIYTAPSEPALSTARAIGAELGVEVKELDGLRNFDQGLWEGLQLQDVRRKYPKVFKQWRDSPETICPPQGETIVEAVDRIRGALRRPMKRKSHFAVVASEPIATFVRCVVNDQKLCAFELCNGTQQDENLEFLHAGAERVNGFGIHGSHRPTAHVFGSQADVPARNGNH
ncbi:MAG: histidine phosphatase family protein [Planctomycetaceae bacterium]